MSSSTERRTAVFWPAFVVGAVVMSYGVRGLVQQAGAETAGAVGRWIVGADLAHDLLLAPLVIATGWAVGRLTPAWARAPVQTGLIATGVVLLIGWAPLRGYGRATAPGNPSVLPLDYGTAVATVLAIVWALVAIWLTGRRIRNRRS